MGRRKKVQSLLDCDRHRVHPRNGRGQLRQKVVYPNPTAAALTAPPVYGSAAHSNTYKMDRLLFSEQNLSPVGGPSTASVVNDNHRFSSKCV